MYKTCVAMQYCGQYICANVDAETKSKTVVIFHKGKNEQPHTHTHDSNPRHTTCETGALPTELPRLSWPGQMKSGTPRREVQFKRAMAWSLTRAVQSPTERKCFG